MLLFLSRYIENERFNPIAPAIAISIMCLSPPNSGFVNADIWLSNAIITY